MLQSLPNQEYLSRFSIVKSIKDALNDNSPETNIENIYTQLVLISSEIQKNRELLNNLSRNDPNYHGLFGATRDLEQVQEELSHLKEEEERIIDRKETTSDTNKFLLAAIRRSRSHVEGAAIINLNSSNLIPEDLKIINTELTSQLDKLRNSKTQNQEIDPWEMHLTLN